MFNPAAALLFLLEKEKQRAHAPSDEAKVQAFIDDLKVEMKEAEEWEAERAVAAEEALAPKDETPTPAAEPLSIDPPKLAEIFKVESVVKPEDSVTS